MSFKHILGILVLATASTQWSCTTEKDYLVTIHTHHGSMKAILFDETPLHKDNFIKLAQAGRYDSTVFHRVINQFMIQGGDVFTKEKLPTKEQYTLPAEFNPEFFHQKGMLAAARLGDNMNPKKESSGCQFYIVQGKKYTETDLTIDIQRLYPGIRRLLEMDKYAPLRQELQELFESGDMEAYNKRTLGLKDTVEQELGISVGKVIAPERLKAYTTVGGTPHLDDEYTVFGKLVEGWEVLDKIAAVPTMPGDRPVDAIPMKVTVEKISKAKLSKMYGLNASEK
jgi:peptidyl-prolyl cis-trans isomerase B (cyclophilin B)